MGHRRLEVDRAGLERARELRFLPPDHLEDRVALVDEIRVGVLHHVDYDAGRHLHERLSPPEQAAVPHGAAQDPPQDVAATLVGRSHAVRHEERDGSGVIRDHLVTEPLRLE